MIKNRSSYYKTYHRYLSLNKSQKCILCQSKTTKVFLSWKKYKLYECNNCEAIFANIDLKQFSKSNFFSKNEVKKKDFYQEMVSTFNYRKKLFAPERYEYLKSKFKKLNKGFTVLDYGCGSGYFIEYLNSKGLKAKGIDLDMQAVEFCRNRDLDVNNHELNKEENNQYDLITMFDSIEHLYEPEQLFKFANKKLKKNGKILAYTPNIRSLSTQLMGADHNAFAVFDHVCFYNIKSLKYLASKTGFDVESIDFYGLDIKDYLQMRESKDKINYNAKLNDLLNLLQLVVDKSKISNHMRVIFKKIGNLK